jgi:hypothetical protein
VSEVHERQSVNGFSLTAEPRGRNSSNKIEQLRSNIYSNSYRGVQKGLIRFTGDDLAALVTS